MTIKPKKKRKRLINKSQEVHLGEKISVSHGKSEDEDEIHELKNREVEINQMVSNIKRIVQKGGNMYLEQFESFQEKDLHSQSNNSSS